MAKISEFHLFKDKHAMPWCVSKINGVTFFFLTFGLKLPCDPRQTAVPPLSPLLTPSFSLLAMPTLLWVYWLKNRRKRNIKKDRIPYIGKSVSVHLKEMHKPKSLVSMSSNSAKRQG